jgi:HAD superfamily hydrolase (TIGR01509 family)
VTGRRAISRRETSGIRAVVFDFDGLVLDTELPVYSAWCAAFEAHGATPPTIQEWGDEIGTSGGIDLEAWLLERATMPVDLDVMHQTRRAHHQALVAQEVARPGVEAWLDESDAAGLGLAIASSSPADWVLPLVERLGLRARFSTIVTAEGELRGKPAPDTYLEACARLGVETRHALAVEDSPHGIAAAKAAGLFCVTVPHALTAPLDLSAADVRLSSLADRTLADVIGELEDRAGR